MFGSLLTAAPALGQPLLPGLGRWQLREALVAFALALLVVLQWGYVVRAATSNPWATNQNFVFVDCLTSGKGGKPPGSLRDCLQGQGSECTLASPCTPCSVNLLLTLTPRNGGVNCAACSNANPGLCYFLPGVGPYCRFEPNVTAPCERCCFDAAKDSLTLAATR